MEAHMSAQTSRKAFVGTLSGLYLPILAMSQDRKIASKILAEWQSYSHVIMWDYATQLQKPPWIIFPAEELESMHTEQSIIN